MIALFSTPTPEAPPPSAQASHDTWWSVTNAMTMSSVVLIFGLVAMALATTLAMRKRQRPIEDMTILKIVAIPMAIVSALFLVVAGYADSQIAPAMGLLGTIVGYVLGRNHSEAPGEKPQVAAAPPHE